MLDTLTHLITNYGYIIIAVFILLECGGFPLPGETVLLVAAGFAGAGKLSIIIVILIAASAAILGNAGGYWIGRFVGKSFMNRFGKVIGLNQKKISTLERFFMKHGAVTVFFGRFISILRTYSAIFAGISRMPYIKFSLFNALGGIIWAFSFGMIGYLFGQNLDDVEILIRVFGWGALLGATLLFGIWYLRHWASSVPRQSFSEKRGILGWISRVRSVSALVITGKGPYRLSRASVIIMFAVGLIICCLLILFVSSAVRGLIEYDPLIRFEEWISRIIDNWLSDRQELLFMSIAKLGAAISILIGAGVSVAAVFLKRKLYMFTMMFALIGGETLNGLLAFLNRQYEVLISTNFFVLLGNLLALDNMIAPVVVFGLLAYFAILSTRQLAIAVSIMIGMSLPALLIIVSRFLSGIHGGVIFFEELLCSIVWLWICIGLMQFIRLKQQSNAILKEITGA